MQIESRCSLLKKVNLGEAAVVELEVEAEAAVVALKVAAAEAAVVALDVVAEAAVVELEEVVRAEAYLEDLTGAEEDTATEVAVAARRKYLSSCVDIYRHLGNHWDNAYQRHFHCMLHMDVSDQNHMALLHTECSRFE
jgi:hypothetical protein